MHMSPYSWVLLTLHCPVKAAPILAAYIGSDALCVLGLMHRVFLQTNHPSMSNLRTTPFLLGSYHIGIVLCWSSQIDLVSNPKLRLYLYCNLHAHLFLLI